MHYTQKQYPPHTTAPHKYHWHTYTYTINALQLIIFSASHCFLFPKHFCSHFGGQHKYFKSDKQAISNIILPSFFFGGGGPLTPGKWPGALILPFSTRLQWWWSKALGTKKAAGERKNSYQQGRHFFGQWGHWGPLKLAKHHTSTIVMVSSLPTEPQRPASFERCSSAPELIAQINALQKLHR